MKTKKIRKYLIVLMAVIMVASFAVIPTSANCVDFQGGHGDGVYQTGSDYLYSAWGYAYCPNSPYWCYVYTTCGNSWDSGDPLGWDNDTARAAVDQGYDTKIEADAQSITNAAEGCHC